MKAMILKGPMDLAYEEVPDPICPNDGIVIKIDACGICGSDLRTYQGDSQGTVYPSILGHEISGTVTESNNGCFPIGTKISVAPVVPCGECWYCKRGIENLCENLRMIGIGRGIPGGFAEYMSLPGDILAKGCINVIEEGVDSVEAVLSETASSCLNAQENAGIGMKDELVLIIGSGTIGCLHSDIAELRGVTETLIIDMSADKVKIAHEQGFKNVLNLGSNSKELKNMVFNKTEGRGADIVICACPSGQAQADALNLVRKRGKVIFFGGISKGTLVPLNTNLIHYNEINIYGASAYTPIINKMAFNLIKNKRIDAKKYITHRYQLKDLNLAFDEMKRGLMIKGVVIP